MSKRSEEAALRLYPESGGPMERSIFEDRKVTLVCRRACEKGYEQAEKDMIERAIKWLKEHWREYVWTTDNSIPHFGHWERDFRKAMEEEL